VTVTNHNNMMNMQLHSLIHSFVSYPFIHSANVTVC